MTVPSDIPMLDVLAMSQKNQDRALALIAAVLQRLAAFASQSCAAHGRGAVHASIPELPPGMTSVSPEMVYYTLEEIRDLARDVHGALRDQADVLIGMTETSQARTASRRYGGGRRRQPHHRQAEACTCIHP